MMQTMFQGHQSCGSCKEGLKGIHYLKIVCEHDQEIPQSQTADNPMALQGRDTQPSRDTRGLLHKPSLKVNCQLSRH